MNSVPSVKAARQHSVLYACFLFDFLQSLVYTAVKKHQEGGPFMERVTIYDIARIAKVSASTVSRAISGNAPVKKATQERIFKIMREYNYIPNAAARALVTQSSRMVGVLVTDLRTTQHTSGIYYIERELSANGYSCLIYNTGRREEDWVRYIRMLSEREVDAAILMGAIYQSETVRQALQTHLPQKQHPGE